jgi:hypothetical protein
MIMIWTRSYQRVHPVDDDASKSSSIHGDIISVTDIEKAPSVPFLDLGLEVAYASSDSSEDILRLFGQDPNKKEKPLKGMYEKYSIEAAWKQQSYLESIMPKNKPQII